MPRRPRASINRDTNSIASHDGVFSPAPFTVIAGYYNTGKTTLVHHILRHNDGRRLAVVVDDMSSLSVDGALIAYRDVELFVLTNGCICCSAAVGLTAALHDLSRRFGPPEHILIEASGDTEPGRITEYAIREGHALDAIVTMVDVTAIRAQAANLAIGPLVMRQLHQADLLLLNKVERASRRALEDTRAWLEGQMPRTRMLETVHAAAPLAVLLGTGYDQRAQPYTADPDAESDHATWTFETDALLDRKALQSFLMALPKEVLRGSGVIYLHDDPGVPHHFHLAGKRWSVKPGLPWGEGEGYCRITLIGLQGSLDVVALEAAMGRVAPSRDRFPHKRFPHFRARRPDPAPRQSVMPA